MDERRGLTWLKRCGNEALIRLLGIKNGGVHLRGDTLQLPDTSPGWGRRRWPAEVAAAPAIPIAISPTPIRHGPRKCFLALA